MCISFNNNTNVKIFQILSIHTIQNGLSQKTISRYCPFKLFLTISQILNLIGLCKSVDEKKPSRVFSSFAPFCVRKIKPPIHHVSPACFTVKVLDLSYKYGLKNTKKRCAEMFLANRAAVLARIPDLAAVVSNIPPLGLELLGIDPECQNKFYRGGLCLFPM